MIPVAKPLMGEEKVLLITNLEIDGGVVECRSGQVKGFWSPAVPVFSALM